MVSNSVHYQHFFEILFLKNTGALTQTYCIRIFKVGLGIYQLRLILSLENSRRLSVPVVSLVMFRGFHWLKTIITI